MARALTPRGVRCYAVEPEGAEALAGGDVSRPDHPVQGGGYPIADLTRLSGAPLAGYLTIGSNEARHYAHLLARVEGIFGGYSAGANLAAAIKLLQEKEVGGTIAFVVRDSGLKYLLTDLWEDIA